MQLNLLPTIQQAISGLLLTYEPEFLRFGFRLFISFATIIIAWHGHPDDVLARRPGRVRCSSSPSCCCSSRSATR